jgi:hypothetical protein
MSIDALLSSERPLLTRILGEFRAYGTAAGRSRKDGRFLAFVSIILIAALILAAPNAEAEGAHVFTVVYPTGVFPDDVQNVQAAADKGGTVFLRAVNASGVRTAFNFGSEVHAAFQSGHVSLNTDVEIIGERGENYGATIKGGFSPFQGLVPVKSKIRGINFESPFSDAIVILASTGSEVTENTVHNVVPIKVRVPSGRIITFADGIDFFGQPQITGKVRVSENVIDGLGAIFSNGIQFDTVAADVKITGNIIRNVNSVNTVTGGGITIIRCQKSVFIADNLIIPGASQSSSAGGVFIDGDHDAVYKVIHNEVAVEGPNEDGIDVAGGAPTGTTGTVNAVIRENYITLRNASNSGGIVLFDLVTDSLIEENKIEGDGFLALGVTTYGFQIGIASLNRFIDNDIEGFSSSFADVFFDANAQNNLMVGECKSVIDLGVGNSATCDADRSDSAKAMASTALASAGVPTAAAQISLRKQQPFVGMLPFIVRAEPIQ